MPHNLGSEFSVLTSYYKPKWHLADEFGFDKSITAHLKLSDIMNDSYSEKNEA